MIELSFGALGITTANLIIIVILMMALFVSTRRTQYAELLPLAASQELKGLAILAIVLAHISYMLVTNPKYLFPLASAAGVGVDLFLFLSGLGLTVGLLKEPVSPLAFYRARLIKIFVPLWVVVTLLLIADTLFLQRNYSSMYVMNSLLGWYPTASGYEDVNSPFWYISWLMVFYLLLPLFFSRRRPWLTALALAAIANVIAFADPLNLQVDWLHRLHTNAFSLGMVAAWLIHEPTKSSNSVALKLKTIRDDATPWLRSAVVWTLLFIAAYFAYCNDIGSWPTAASVLDAAGFDAKAVIGQATSLVSMLAVVIAFSLKRVEFKLLYVFGVYSFETYLIHWPLMSRYDVFFNHTPAWLAPCLWLMTFIVLAWLLEHLTTPLSRWLDGLRDERHSWSLSKAPGG